MVIKEATIMKTSKRRPGEGGYRRSDPLKISERDLSLREQCVLNAIRRMTSLGLRVLDLNGVARAAFPNMPRAKAYRCTLNQLRRLTAGQFVDQVGGGAYVVRKRGKAAQPAGSQQEVRP